MIAFVTLLLGLISGVYPIEVTVGGPVAAVEMTLDGAPAGRIEAPPWVTKINLGGNLQPHHLVARGLDAGGNEIARTEQWLNLPRPPAEVEVVLERGADGVPKTAVLTWQSVSGGKPLSVSLTLDDRPLVVGSDGRASLPATSLEELHVVTAELWFPPGLTARRDVIFGGKYGSEVATELTAVPVRLAGGAPLPPLRQLEGWFTAGGQPVAATAVEEGPGKVAAVCVPTGNEILDKLVARKNRAGLLPTLRTEMRLGPEDRFHLLSLSSIPFRGSRVPSELFQISQPLTSKDGGVFLFLTDKRMSTRDTQGERRIADAVAVAGLQATAENHRRAVVLVLGRDVEDSSQHDPAKVRRYLESIHVPLFVWSLYGDKTKMAKEWGPVEDISSTSRLSDAVRRLRAELDRQHIVWLDGRYLPNTIALTPAAAGAEIVGTP
jgi:hypothetical protein